MWSSRRGSRDIEHVGSAHDGEELEALKAAANQRLAAGQGELDLGLDVAAGSGPLAIMASRMGHLWDALCRAYDVLGFAEAAGGDEVFRQLVLARIIEPTSKQDSLRVLEEVGVGAASYPTLNRRLPVYAQESWRRALAAACARHAALGPASLVLYDVSTLYFETDAGDGFREPGFSKERRLEPQITLGLLTDAAGFPLMVPDGHVFTQPWPATQAQKAKGRRDKVIYYQYRADRARRTLRGIDEQVIKAEKAVARKVAVKRNRFIKLTGTIKSVNRDLEAKARDLAGLKGYTTSINNPTAEFVIGAYHQLWRIEKSFRMSKHDLRARPIYHHKRESIDAHLTIVFAALAITQFIEDRTGWSIKKFVTTARRYRTVQIRAGHQLLTAEDPLPTDLRDALAQIT